MRHGTGNNVDSKTGIHYFNRIEFDWADAEAAATGIVRSRTNRLPPELKAVAQPETAS